MPLPQQFGSYRILRQLGRGGMGVVYLADAPSLGCQVALKVPRFTEDDSPEVIQRFCREGRASIRVRHPNVCRVYEVGEIDGRHFLSMEYIDGPSLDKVLARKPLPAIPWAVKLVWKLALALNAAHRVGVIHRDVKPGNVLLRANDEPVLTDFGLAHCLEDVRMTRSGAVVGTPAYMAPEQLGGSQSQAGPGSDIYSLGVVLYELLTGRVPFEGPPLAVLGQHATQEPAPPSRHRPGLDPRFDAICRRALAKTPDQRYASMAEFAADLAQVSEVSAPLVGSGPSDDLAAWFTRVGLALGTALVPGVVAAILLPRGVWSAAGVAAAALAGGLTLLLYPRRDAARTAALTASSRPGSHAETSMSGHGDRRRDLVNSVGMRLVRVPPGRFLMGAPSREVGHGPNEEPQHLVNLTRPLYIGACTVTQRQYFKVMNVNPSHFHPGNGGSWDHPVETVSWTEAQEFCRRLSDRPEERQQRRTYRLPTEAEWEYACRAGTTTAFHFGDSLSSTQANFDGNFPYGNADKGPYLKRTTAVGSYTANLWGLYDVHGNVWEWCADWYDEQYYRVSPPDDPPGPPNGWLRVLRGGAWLLPGRSCRAAVRDKLPPGFRGPQVGFRVVCAMAPDA